MKKSGFTLAEILITMSIIGVVAALSAPALIQDAANARTGPALEKTRAAIELANQEILFRNRATDLLALRPNDAPINEGSYLQLLARNFQNSTYLPVGSPQNVLAFQFTDRNGVLQSGTREWTGNRTGAGGPNDGTPKLVLADNVTISVDVSPNNPAVYRNFTDNGNMGQNGSYRGPIADLLIDLNGTQVGPNTFGRDIFFFTVDRSGVVIPDGSNLFNDYLSWPNGNPQGFTWDTPGGTYQCNDVNVGSGRGCAGSVLDNPRRRVIYR